MKLFKHIELSKELIEKIASHFPKKIYKGHSPLFYEGQIPISGYLILDGSVQISKKKKAKKMLHGGSLIAVNELVNKKPITISAEAYPNTEICFIDRSTLMEMYLQADPELLTVLDRIIEFTK